MKIVLIVTGCILLHFFAPVHVPANTPAFASLEVPTHATRLSASSAASGSEVDISSGSKVNISGSEVTISSNPEVAMRSSASIAVAKTSHQRLPDTTVAPILPDIAPTLSDATPILPGAARMNLYLPLLQGRSVAIFANQTSLVGKTHLVDTLLKKGIHIAKIFSPEHGFRGDADAGQHVGSQKDSGTGIPIISLYGNKNKPSAADLEDVDVMLFDIQDVGVRFYTYISSLQKYIESAVSNHRPLIVLDRPNPNGFYVDGPVLQPAFKSFVGMQPIPVVYGMTIGEYARMLIGEQWLDSVHVDGTVRSGTIRSGTIGSGTVGSGTVGSEKASPGKTRSLKTRNMNPGAGNTGVPNGHPGEAGGPHVFQLTVIPCKNYTHKSKYVLPVAPSPNLPNMQSVYLYPSLCFFEGTAVSLGRGTDKPFQQFGHPAFPAGLYHFTPLSVAGARNPPLLNQLCYGYDLSTIDVAKETGNRLSLKWLISAYRLFPDKDHFFIGEGKFFNKLAGNDLLQQQLKEEKTEAVIRQSWQPALDHFRKIRKKYLLYAD